MDKGYTYIWEYRVAPESRLEFERHYGKDGGWVQLFRRSEGYVETIFLIDQADPGRYVTIDRWRSEDDYMAFHAAFSEDYVRLDSECEHLTVDEIFFGAFDEHDKARG